MVEVVAAIDSNIFISIINKEPDSTSSKKILDLIDEGKIRAILSTIVIAEIVSGYQEIGDLEEMDEFLSHILRTASYDIVDVTVSIALEAGNLRAKSGFKLPDAIIAASALHRKAEFLISNDDRIRKPSLDKLKVLTAAEFARTLGNRMERGQTA
jgi:predicted nucleic acid-binding protein